MAAARQNEINDSKAVVATKTRGMVRDEVGSGF
jgi:cytochrome c-type biogenesis protein CcmH/NrfF